MFGTTLQKQLATISSQLNQIIVLLTKGPLQQLMIDLTALTTAVAAEQTVEGSAITLLQGLSTEITTLIANSGNTVDPVALAAIVTQINTNASTLAAAVAANTPASPSTTSSVTK